MTKIKLNPCDAILYQNDRTDPISSFSRWAIGPYEHCSLYLGKAWSIPFLYESDGRGVQVASLYRYMGRPVLILRPDITDRQRNKVIDEGISIASALDSYYDYLAIVRFCVPYVLKRKFPWLPNPPEYKRDKYMICSEALAEAFWRADIPILPKDAIPLPGDFVKSPVLYPVGQGKLLKDVVPDGSDRSLIERRLD
jgi:hypothetical protein